MSNSVCRDDDDSSYQHLSKRERAALLAYLGLRKQIDPDEDFSAEVGALEGGYPGYYPEFLLDTGYLDKELPDSTIEYVLKTLEVYDWVQRVVRIHSLEPSRSTVCPGFDGNAQRSPSGALGFARYVTQVLNRFEVRFASPDLNSHGVEGDYRAKHQLMLEERDTISNPEHDLARTLLLVNQLLGPA
jgi:hypothetical protein